MATQTTGGGSTTSFTNTPQAKDDNYTFLEDVLRNNSSLYIAATNTVILDVMANDLGGNAKTLFSVEDGDGNPLTADFDLLVKDIDATGVSPWELTFGGNWVRISNGKIEYRIADGSGVPGQGRSVDSLTAGEIFADQFVYAIRLGNGTLSEATVKINITGANDNASIAVVVSDNGVVEAGGVANGIPGDPNAGGTLVVNDTDLGENKFQAPASGALVGSYGNFTFNPLTGAWTYTLNNALASTQGLDDGEFASETLTVKSFDGTASYNIVVTITGADDAPTLQAVTAGSIAEVDQSSSTTSSGLSGTLVGADVDVETLTYGIQGVTPVGGIATQVSTYGTLTVNTSTGAYSFAPNAAAIEGLDVGENPSVNFIMTVSDGDGPTVNQSYTVNLSGADDAPTLQAVASGSVAEVDQSSTTTDAGLSGLLVGADVDVETLTYGIVGGSPGGPNEVVLAGTYGTLTVNTLTGAYSYAKNASAIEALDDGESPSDVFTVSVSDGDGPLVTQSYTVNLTGADDAPTLGAVASGSVAEVDQSSTTTDAGLSGLLVGADVDVETLTYGIVGGSPGGPNEVVLAGTYGTLTVNTLTGAYSYAKNASAIEALDDGESPSDVFTVSVSDGDGPLVTQSYTVNLTGADDAPTLQAVASGSVAEVDQSSTTTDAGLSGLLVGADVDVETLTYGIVGGSPGGPNEVVLAGTYGTLTVNTLTGAYSYAKNASAIEALDDGESPSDVFTVSVSDGDGPLVTQSYTVNLTGADDAPTLQAVASGSVAEVDQSSTTTDAGLSGLLVGADVDVETLTYGIVGGSPGGPNEVVLAGTYGTLTVNTLTGAYSYAKNASAIEALDDGESPSDVFTVSVSDGDGPLVTQSYTVNLTGADDAPTLQAVASGSVAEVDQSSTTTDAGLSGLLVGADVDVETLTYGIVGGSPGGPNEVVLAGTYGTLTVNTLTGAYSYAKNASAIEALDDGESPSDVFTVSVSDGDGPLVTQSYTVNLTGADDAPTLQAVASGSVAEVDQSSTTTDAGLSGLLVGADVDVETLTYGIVGGSPGGPNEVVLAGTYGTLTVNTLTGAYSYAKNASAIEALDDGESPSDVFTVSVSDGDGPLVTQSYTVNLTGADDAPTLQAVASGSVAEVDQSSTTTDAGLSGLLVGADVDVETLTYGIVGGSPGGPNEVVLAGTYGTLTVNTLTGAYSYAKNASAIEALDDGESPSDVFTVSVSDGDGPLVTQSYTVNLTGADDAPTLGAVASGSVAEVDQSSTTTDAGLSGLLVGADVDVETLTYGIVGGSPGGPNEVVLAGTYGTLTVNTLTGAYSYAKNASAIEALDDGESPSDVFTVSVSDGDGPLVTQSYTVNLTGADDAPTLQAVASGSVAEVDQSSTTTDAGLSGLLVGADVDVETLTYGIVGGSPGGPNEVVLAGTYGTLTVNTLTGAYSYAKNASAIEALDDGESPSDVFTVSVSDGDGPLVTQSYTVNLTGADDAPTLQAVASGSVAEVDQSSTTTDAGLSGLLVGADVDVETLTYGIVGGSPGGPNEVVLAGTYGTLTVNTLTGAYSYAKNASAIEALDDGESPSDVFTVSVSDGDGPLVTQSYTVNLTGADDAPTLGAVASGSVAEVDQSSTTTDAGLSGLLVGADVDVETLTYGIVGGSPGGPNEVVLAGTYGTLTVNTLTGAYSYAKNASAIEALDDGESPSDVFTVSVSDGDGPLVTQSYTVNLTGADDAPTLQAVASGSVAEVDQSSTTTDAGLSGLLVGADVDVETLTYGIVGGSPGGPNEVVLAGTYGTLTVNTLTGAYSYAKNASAIEALDDGESPSDVFTVSVSDGDGPLVTQSYTVNLTGADDAPTLQAVASGSVAEVDQSSTTTDAGLSGLLVGADVDVETLTYGIVGGSPGGPNEVVLAGTYGTLTVNTLTGAYSYAKNASAIEALDDGESPSDVFTVSVSDGDGPLVTQSYTVNLTGADDAPTLGAVASGSVAEVDQSSTTTDAGLSGLLVGADVDVETLTYGIVGGSPGGPNEVVLAGTYGTLTVNTLTGAYSYAKNASAIEALDDGESPSDVFTVSVSDGDGPLVTQSYTVNLTGADDAPTLGAVASGSVAEVDQSSTTTDAGLSGLLVGADVDVETLTYGIVGGSPGGPNEVVLAGTYGTLTVNTLTGAYSYAKNASAIEALDDGESPSDVFTVSVSDGDGPLVTQSYTVNLTGADDAPTLQAVASGSVAEVDQSSTTTDAGLSGLLVGADVDVETLTYGIVGGSPGGPNEVVLAGTYGTLTVNTLTGAYSYAKNASAIEALDDGESPSDVFTVSVSDGDGPLVTQSYTVNLTGADDAPTLGAVASGSVAEVDQSSTTTDAGLSGLLVGADVDVETLTYGIVGGSPGGPNEVVLAGTYGTLTVNTLTGAYSYAKNASAIEALDDGESPSDVFTVSVSDGDGPLVTQSYTVNLTGADDAPTLGAVTAGSIAEVDQSSSITSSGLSGTLVGADVDVETLTYGVVGGTVSAGVSTLVNTYGTLTVNTSTGAYSFTPNAAAIDALDAGENPSLNFTMTVSDGDGPTVNQTYTVNLSGADDTPTLAAVTSGSIAEVSQSSATTSSGLSGTLVGSDVDVETLTYGVQGGTVSSGVSTLVDPLGTLTVNTSTGAYTFVPNAAAIEALDSGENPVLNFTMTVSDGDAPLGTQTYTINVSGADDAPTLAPVTSGSIAEVPNSTATTSSGLSGTLVGADVDVETLSYGIQGGSASGVNLVSLAGTYGTLTVNTVTGAYSYAPNSPAIEALNTGQNPSDVFTMTVSDGDAPLGTQTYTVNLTGADDAPAQTVITNLVLGTPIIIPEYALLYTGGFPSGDISGVSSPVGGTVTHTPGTGTLGNVTFTDAAPAGGSFAYTTTTPVATTTVGVSQDIVGTIDGTSANDILISANGGATLQGNAGNDVLLGGSGNDTYVFGLNDGNDVITDSGSGGDEIVITTSAPLNSTSISNLNFEQTSLNLAINVGNTLIVVREHYANNGSQIETVTFSNGGTIFGYELNTTGYRLSTDTTSPLDGGGNEDIIASTINGQTLTGGNKNDLLFGNGGNDNIDGGAGDDLIMGGDGTDTITGGGDNDTIVGQGGADTVTGGSGTDTFVLTDAATFDTITDYAAGEVIDITTLLTTAGSLSGFVRLTAAGDLQLDADGGGNSYVTIAHINTAAVNATVTYSTGPGTSATVTVIRGAPPIGIDLDGDGQVSFLATDAGAHFDYGGGKVATAWVAANDGILVRDANGDGQVSADEIVFATSGSDLDGLAVFDSNHDGQLSAEDAAFEQFGVWQDADSDGQVDAGELQSLTAHSIASISLSSDGIGYSAAGGDVQVVGTGSFTRLDGSTGVLADSVFATGGRIVESDLRLMAAAGNSNVIAAAVAAMGLVSTSAHASVVGDDGPQIQHQGLEVSVAFDHTVEPMDSVAGGFGQADFNLGFGSQVVAIQPGNFHLAMPAFDSNHSLIGSELMAPVEQSSFQPASSNLAAVNAMPAAAPMVAMPSAEMLAAAFDGSNLTGSAHVGDAAGVLAEVLAGGHESPIDAMLEAALPQSTGDGHGGSLNAIADAIHSQIPAFSGIAGFGLMMGHDQFAEMAICHPDNLPPV